MTVPVGELGTGVTDFGGVLEALMAFEDLEGVADLVPKDLEGLEVLVEVEGASSFTRGVAIVRLVPRAMIGGI